MNVLIDTNVVLDAVTGRAPYNISAERLFLLAADDTIDACITASSVTDIYYLLHKYLHDSERSKEALAKLFGLFRILDVTGSDCRKALTISMSDYEDAVLAVCAKRNRVDVIVTRNEEDFGGSPVRVATPDEFLASFKERTSS